MRANWHGFLWKSMSLSTSSSPLRMHLCAGGIGGQGCLGCTLVTRSPVSPFTLKPSSLLTLVRPMPSSVSSRESCSQSYFHAISPNAATFQHDLFTASFGHWVTGPDPMPTRSSSKDQRPNVHRKDPHGTIMRTVPSRFTRNGTIHSLATLNVSQSQACTHQATLAHQAYGQAWVRRAVWSFGPPHACPSLHAPDVFVRPEVFFVTSYACTLSPIICMDAGTLRPLRTMGVLRYKVTRSRFV